MKQKQNEGTLDRAARGLFSVIFLALGISKARTTLGKVFIGLGTMLGVTAATGNCPAYSVVGLDTRESCSVDRMKQRLGL